MTSPDDENSQRAERERLTDVSDRATQVEQETFDAAMGDVRRRLQQDQSPRYDGTYAVEDCDDCGNPIGEGRLRLAPRNLICVHCATAREKRR